jgi:hypothetical protein
MRKITEIGSVSAEPGPPTVAHLGSCIDPLFQHGSDASAAGPQCPDLLVSDLPLSLEEHVSGVDLHHTAHHEDDVRAE